jgi:hypothetical protein
MLLRTPTLATTALAAIPVFGGPAETYTGCSETSAGQDLAVATFHETVARGGDF